MVALDLFQSPTGQTGTFLGDILAAARARAASRSVLFDLLFDHLEATLAGMSPSQLDAYLASINVWRTHGKWKVYKNVDTPCVAYTVYVHGGDVYLLALAACDTYPNNDVNVWWTKVIVPRLNEL